MGAARKLKSEESDAIDEMRNIVDDLYLVANLLETAGRGRLSKDAAELADSANGFLVRLKGELTK